MKRLELLEKYKFTLDLKFRSSETKKSYISVICKFMDTNNTLTHISEDNLKEYLSAFRLKYSDSYFNVMGSALKILYSEVLKQSIKMQWFKPVKTERKFHNIVTQEQFISMMKSTSNIKHKLIIIMLYSTGIRETELINLKLDDVDLFNQRIFIRSLKNGKNRFIPLHELTIRYIKSYIRQFSPVEYLLNGQNNPKYSASSIRNICKKCSDYSVYPHLLRHTYLTNVIEKEDVFAAMELAGHRSLNSTLHYNHISPDRKLFNPLDKIAV